MRKFGSFCYDLFLFLIRDKLIKHIVPTAISTHDSLSQQRAIFKANITVRKRKNNAKK